MLRVSFVICTYLMLSVMCNAQLTSTGCAGETNYTDGQPNDVVYFFPPGINGELTVTPEVTGNSFTFKWYRFVTGTNAWALYQTVNNAPNSTLSNLIPAAYQVVITQGTSTVGCYRAWIAQILVEPQVSVQPIDPSCNGPINLQGSFTPGQMTAISNLPDAQLLINSDTQISVCFSGTHTWISDLAFYVKGPSTCGSPTILLSPNPGAIGQPATCNSSNNINNLCFSTESNNNLNVCNGMNGLSGTYGSYGPGSTPINWAGLYGCDAMNGGWTVQVYDCVAIDVGSLTDATITFNGTDICGNVQSTSYTTPNGFNSVINDNSCSAATASSYVVAPTVPPALLNCTFGYEWTSNPPVQIPNATSSLNITINNLTSPNGTAIPWQDIEFTLTATTACTDVSVDSECWGGNMTDSESYIQVANVQSEISEPSTICIENGAIILSATPAGGTWSGNGISNSSSGLFNPSNSGVGTHTISYDFDSPCVLSDQIEIEVASPPSNPLPASLTICLDAEPYEFGQPLFSGEFNGNGIIDPLAGIFDASISGPGLFEIELTANTICPATFMTEIDVIPLPDIIHTNDTTICTNNPTTLFAGGAQNYQWSPAFLFSNPNSANPSISIVSSQTISVMATDQFGCQTEETIEISVFSAPVISVDDANMICPGSEGSLFASASPGNLIWLDALGNIIGNTNPLMQTLSNSTVFTAELVDQCNVTISTTAEIPVESGYSVSMNSTIAICDGEIATLTAITGTNEFESLSWSTADGVLNGNTNALSVTTNSSGTYTMIGTSPLGCNYSDETIVTVNALPNVSAGNNLTLCAGEAATISGSGALQYQWSPAPLVANANAASTTITATNNGTLTLIGTDQNGCSAEDSIVFTVLEAPVISTENPDIICPGESIVLTATGNYSTFSWQDALGNVLTNNSNLTINPLVTSNYTAILNSDCNVEVTSTVTVPVEDLYTIDLIDNINICEGTNIELNGYVSPNNAVIQWTTADGVILSPTSSEIITVSSEGTYQISLTTPLGCIYSDMIAVTEVVNPTLTVTSDTSICSSLPFNLNAIGAMQYSWTSTGVLSDATIDSPSITITSDGSATVIGIDNNGCSDTAQIELSVIPAPSLAIIPVSMICPNETVILQAIADDGVFEWSDDQGNIIGNNLAVSVSPSESSSYTFTIADACGIGLTATVNVPVESGYAVDAGINTGLCPNESITITANTTGNGASYEWSTPDGIIASSNSNEFIITSTPGNYIIYQTSPMGCAYTDSVQISQYAEPIIFAGVDADVCYNLPYLLTASGGVSYSWSPGANLSNTNTSNPQATLVNNATYYLTGTDANGCVGYDTINLTLIPLPEIAIDPVQMICPGNTVSLTAISNYSNISWAPISGLSATTGNSVDATPVSTTTFTATVIDNSCGLTAESSVLVEVEGDISISAGQDQSFCEGGSVSVQAEIAGDYTNLIWSSPSGANFIPSGTTAISTSEAGTFSASITSPMGCLYSDEVIVNEVMYPVVNLEDSIAFCPGDSTTITILAGYDNINWSNGDTTAETTISVEGLYNVNVLNSTCATTDTFYVYQVEFPYFDLGEDREVCEGDSVTINAGIDGEWSGGSISSFVTVSQEGDYTFTLEQSGCYVSDNVHVEVIELPDYKFYSPQYACIGENHILQPVGVNATYFEWEGGQTGETLSVDAPGNYYVIASNECGSAIADVDVVFQDCEGLVFIPNCFTPDGDGINDVWIVVGSDIKGMELKIYNRWGDVVYHSQEINPVWTGGFEGGDYYLSDGMYFFDIEVVLARGQTIRRKGSFRMFR